MKHRVAVAEKKISAPCRGAMILSPAKAGSGNSRGVIPGLRSLRSLTRG